MFNGLLVKHQPVYEKLVKNAFYVKNTLRERISTSMKQALKAIFLSCFEIISGFSYHEKMEEIEGHNTRLSYNL